MRKPLAIGVALIMLQQPAAAWPLAGSAHSFERSGILALAGGSHGGGNHHSQSHGGTGGRSNCAGKRCKGGAGGGMNGGPGGMGGGLGGMGGSAGGMGGGGGGIGGGGVGMGAGVGGMGAGSGAWGRPPWAQAGQQVPTAGRSGAATVSPPRDPNCPPKTAQRSRIHTNPLWPPGPCD